MVLREMTGAKLAICPRKRSKFAALVAALSPVYPRSGVVFLFL